ncbi:MAG: DUF4349 domain-containing protein [Lacisediminihabitans sp.]
MRRLSIPAVFVLAALSLVGCSAGASNGSGSVGDRGGSSLVKPAAPAAGGLAVGSVADAAVGRQVITTGSMTITVKNPARSADDAARIVEQAGGRVDGRTEHAPASGDKGSADKGSAELTVRIPSDKLTLTINELKKLGKVEEIAISSSDVTTRSQDLAARISALRTSVDRLVKLMASATSTQDLITIESALSGRQATLESFESEKRQLDDRVDLATITLRLGSEASAPSHLPDTFLSGLGASWDAFVAFFAGALVVIGVLLPWLALATLITIAVIAILRLRRRRAAAKAEQR